LFGRVGAVWKASTVSVIMAQESALKAETWEPLIFEDDPCLASIQVDDVASSAKRLV